VTALVIKSTPDKVSYDLFSVGGEDLELLVSGTISEIGSENPKHDYRYGKRGRGEGATQAANHLEAFERIASVLRSPNTGPDDYSMKLAVIAHLVPHGGQRFKGQALVTEEVLKAIEACSAFAPRTNPAALEGIRAAMTIFPMAPHVAVFDTAFHLSMPPEAFLYALPLELNEEHGLRRFGFHGISHRHAIGTAAAEMGTFPESLKVISLHLGEEMSAVAFSGGRCVDTTTGLNAQTGLPGACSCGSIDPAAMAFLLKTVDASPEELERLLTERSGVLGLSGLSKNLLEVTDEATKGEVRCQRALKVLAYQTIKAIGGLVASMGGLDLIAISGPIGGKAVRFRNMICAGLAFMGVEVDEAKNEAAQGEKCQEISSEGSRVKVFVVSSDEELDIARDSLALVADGEPE
jgi:acetate kinase